MLKPDCGAVTLFLATSHSSRLRAAPCSLRARSILTALAFSVLMLAGCSRFRPKQKDFVYVSARQVYLHDRVAAVSNRVALVTNGEALEVIERGKRFVKVRTPKGEIGWLEDHSIIDDTTYAQFEDLEKKHANDPVVANGVLRDDLYMHLLPGRETPHFLLIPGNTKVKMLERGTVPKVQPGVPQPTVKTKTPSALRSKPGSAIASTGKAVERNAGIETEHEEPAPPPMEDWWLVRDADGHTGWLLANRVDVDVPDEVGQYSEDQRMIAAYPLTTVIDDGSGRESKRAKQKQDKERETMIADGSGDGSAGTAAAGTPKKMTEYVTVLAPPKNGLPYDFDQVRVFTWSLNHHRYETAYRMRGLQGYLPVTITHENVNGLDEPVFSFAIANGPDVKVDSETGVTRPVSERTLSFRLEGNMVKRTGADMAPLILSHDSADAAKTKASKKKRR